MGRITYEAWDFIADALANPNIGANIKAKILVELALPTPKEVALRQAMLDVMNGALTNAQRLAAAKIIIDSYKESLT